MSRILRRPRFRGGPVDSRGSGITSGLMDGGRVGFNKGNFVTGGELMSLVNTFPELNMYKDSKFNKFTKYNLNDPNQRADVLRIGSFAGNFSGTLFTIAGSSDSTVAFSETTSVLTGAGVTLNSSTGALTTSDFGGASTTPTTYTFTIRLTDAEGQTTDREFSMTSSFGATGGGQFN